MFRNSHSFTNSSSQRGGGGGSGRGRASPLPRDDGVRSRSESRSRSPRPVPAPRREGRRPVPPASPSRATPRANYAPSPPRSPVSFRLPGAKKSLAPPREGARNEDRGAGVSDASATGSAAAATGAAAGGGGDGGGGAVPAGDRSESPSALLPPAATEAGDGGEPSPSSVVVDADAEGGDEIERGEIEGKSEADEKKAADEDGHAVTGAAAAASAAATGDSLPVRDDLGDSVVVGGSGATDASIASDGRLAPAGVDAASTSDTIRNAAVGSAVGGDASTSDTIRAAVGSAVGSAVGGDAISGDVGGGNGGGGGGGLHIRGGDNVEEGLLSGRGRRGDQWRHSPPQGSGGGFGHEPYEMGAGSSSGGEDFEAGAGNFSAGDFDINPRGDGSFSTSAARCFKAVIHRIPVARQALPRVHGGFWEAYSKLREKVLAALAAEMQAEYQPLYISGHSLGGALASLAAYDVNKNFSLPDPITLYTFGSPRVGNAAFASKLNSKVKHHFRVVNDGDLITALPRFFGTYKHAGCKVVVDSERYGNFIVAPTLVEQTFGAKPLASLTPHLLSQYRECLEACMEEADLEDYFSRGIGVDPTLVPEWLKGNRRKDKEDEPALL